MGIGAKRTHDHIPGFQAEIAKAAKKDPATFFNWFNESGGDVDATFLKGECEFSFYILMPLARELKDAKTKTALEIGYGGGRLVAAASKTFGKAIGVDIHTQSKLVEKELQKRGVANVTLLATEGKSIPLPDGSVDVVYSLIVLQHVEKIGIFKRYVAETHRTLKKGGFAVLFFGRPFHLSSGTRCRSLYALDRLLEGFLFRGFIEKKVKVNCTNLEITLSYAKRLCEKEGFSILGQGVSRKLPDATKYGGQHYLVLRKK
jgi:ubiquinone/menaquinone biosynthesis C-methylase UbiE